MASAPATAPQRPPTVTTAVALLMAQAAIGLLLAVIATVSLTQVARRYQDAVGGSATRWGTDQYVLTVRVYCIVLIVYSILLAVATLLLAMGLLRRNRVARTLTMVACIPLIAGGCCGSGALGLSTGMKFGDDAAPSVAELVGTGWWAAMLVLTALQMLAAIGAGVLVLLKPSARYFTRLPTAPQPV